jgi:hypothetical protein
MAVFASATIRGGFPLVTTGPPARGVSVPLRQGAFGRPGKLRSHILSLTISVGQLRIFLPEQRLEPF